MKTGRREFLKQAAVASAALGTAHGMSGCAATEKKSRPNVIMIMTDDQGYGDLGCHGNDLISTPNIDRFASENLEFTRFYVCPTCAPTRAGLLTGRYHHRTGLMGTMSGEALIDPAEITFADEFANAGYRTGIFGKWHLGDNYPRRPEDMGFDEVVVHNGGGLSQPSCPPGVGYHDESHQEKHNYKLYDPLPKWLSSNNYFDPILRKNGEFKQYEGYCTDIFFDEAMKFMEDNAENPFFLYIPTNAPHSPEMVSEDYLNKYRDKGIDDKTARCYAMCENIDDNFGRLEAKLTELGLDSNTIVIFLTDNGPQYFRYNCDLRGKKAQFHEGGIHVPFFIRWPGVITEAGKTDTIAANIDMLPTLLDACGIEQPKDRHIDGVSLVPLLSGAAAGMPDRTLFFQGNHGVPELYNQCAAVGQQYKMVNGSQLFDLQNDPSEKINIAGMKRDITYKLRAEYEAWFKAVGSGRGFAPQKIHLGTAHENPVVVTRQDWRGPRSRFVGKDPLGHWEVDFINGGSYEFTVNFTAQESPGTLHLSAGSVTDSIAIGKGEVSHTFGPLDIAAGAGKLKTWLAKGDDTYGVFSVDVNRLN